MQTTDLHVHVFPYDYYADKPVDTVGLARTASHIRQLREGAANSILLDNGDFLQGNPLGDYIAYERGLQAGDTHPVIAALNAVGVEATTLGNHEFNYGLDFLMKALDGARFPAVSANVVTAAGSNPRVDATLVRPYVLLDRMLVDGGGNRLPIRIGVIGFTPPQIVTWDRMNLEGRVVSRDIVAAARAWVPEMREAGADIVIALSHSGIGTEKHAEGMENASVPLAAVDGIDALLTGHTHLVFPGPAHASHGAVDARRGLIHGKPAVMAGALGSHLGVMDLFLERDAGAWRVIGSAVEARPIARRNVDQTIAPLVDSRPEVLAAARAGHDAALRYVRRPVGHSTVPLDSYFSLVADTPSVRIVCQAQAWYVRGMLKGTGHEGLPILSAAAPFRAGGRAGAENFTEMSAGPLALRNVADLYIFPNRVCAVKITGRQVEDWLERSAGLFNQIVPGSQDTPLINPDFPSYDFDVIDGVTYQIDVTRPARFDRAGVLVRPDAHRIVNLRHAGAPLDPEAEFVVATNSYRAGGGGNFPGASGSTIIFTAPDTNRDAIVRYIMTRKTIDPAAEAGWSLVPVPGTSVVFDSSPRARSHLAGLSGPLIEDAGEGNDGFARFRLRL